MCVYIFIYIYIYVCVCVCLYVYMYISHIHQKPFGAFRLAVGDPYLPAASHLEGFNI